MNNRQKEKKKKYLIIAFFAGFLTGMLVLTAVFLISSRLIRKKEAAQESVASIEETSSEAMDTSEIPSEEESTETETETETETSGEESEADETEVLQETSDEAETVCETEPSALETESTETEKAESTEADALLAESAKTDETEEAVTAAPEESAAPDNAFPHVEEGPVKDMIRLGLTFVSQSCGYSLYDRTGAQGSFDCSGLIAVLLRDGLGEPSIGWFDTDAWDTAYWRYWATLYEVGSTVQIGNASYKVTMRDSYDFEHAWEVPGAIVIQYPPENDPDTKMGHASIALGTVPYQSTQDVIDYLGREYGIDVSGMAGGENHIPMVYDPNGAESGHITWKINANGIAGCVCVDNNYASKAEWIEKIAIVLVPEGSGS